MVKEITQARVEFLKRESIRMRFALISALTNFTSC